MSIKGLLKSRLEGEREGREGLRSKNLAGKKPSNLRAPAPPQLHPRGRLIVYKTNSVMERQRWLKKWEEA